MNLTHPTPAVSMPRTASGIVAERRSTHRQILTNYLVHHGYPFSAVAYYDQYEDYRASTHLTHHLRGRMCSVALTNESSVKFTEWAGVDGCYGTLWMLLGEGFSCSCGELTGLTLTTQGRISEVMLRAMCIDTEALLG